MEPNFVDGAPGNACNFSHRRKGPGKVSRASRNRLRRMLGSLATVRPKCAGPVYFADQGIEVCTACGGCICCDFKSVNHSQAEYECFTDDEGVCHLIAHDGRPCKQPAAAAT